MSSQRTKFNHQIALLLTVFIIGISPAERADAAQLFYNPTSKLLYYLAESGEKNNVTISSSTSSGTREIAIKDSGSGVTSRSISTYHSTACSGTSVNAKCSNVQAFRVELEDQDDYLELKSGADQELNSIALLGGDGGDIIDASSATNSLDIYGDEGEDEIFSGSGNDTIQGGGGDDTWLEGGEGNDTVAGQGGSDVLFGNGGDDELYGGNRSSTDTDTDKIYGGNDSDTVYYNSRTETVTVTNDSSASSGETGENDLVATSIENVVTGSGDDVIKMVGASSSNTVSSGSGSDQVNIQDSGSISDYVSCDGAADEITKDDNDSLSDDCIVPTAETPVDDSIVSVSSGSITNTQPVASTTSSASIEWAWLHLLAVRKKRLTFSAQLKANGADVAISGTVYAYSGKSKVKVATLSGSVGQNKTQSYTFSVKNKSLLKTFRKKKRLRLVIEGSGSVSSQAMVSNAGQTVTASLDKRLSAQPSLPGAY